MTASEFTVMPTGPFSLATQNAHFGGWAGLGGHQGSIVMAFPVEGGSGSAAVVIHQDEDGTIHGRVHGTAEASAVWAQACAVLSVDVDGSGYVGVGERDPVMGRIQKERNWLRPVLFHSAYEAACSFIIGHRISIAQGRIIRTRIAEQHGEAIPVAEEVFHAFPAPAVLAGLTEIAGVSAEKLERLHGAARAALAGQLDRNHLRGMPVDEAVEQVRQLRGIGAFFAQGIVLRGAGTIDEVPGDDFTVAGIQRFYELAAPPDRTRLLEIADAWRPYRTWCSVLVHASERRAQGQGPGGTRPRGAAK